MTRIKAKLARWVRRLAGRTRSGQSECGPTDPATLERPRYFAGQAITAEDLTQEQIYFREKLRRHNRLLHGWGIICGLDVGAAGGCHVQISPGYAIDQTGEEIVIPEPVRLDVCAKSPAADGWMGFLALRYVAEATRPVPHDDTEYSRTRDGFELGVLDKLPRTDESWIVLAGVTVTAGEVSLDPERHRRYVE
jgi:hypothetical protein